MSLRGTALVRTSEPLGGPGEGPENVLDMALDFFGSRKYHLVLDVRLPGREPYAIEGTWKVPSKAEQTGFLRSGSTMLPAGVEVPVEVSERDPAKVDVDWDAYVKQPDRKRKQKALYDQYRAEKTARYVEEQARKRQR